MRWSLEAGRVPSLLGREIFRSRVTSYGASTFEDKILFLYDVERCLDRFGDFDQQLVARAILQEHTHEATARLLHCTRKTVERRLPDLLDELSDAFLRVELLSPFPQTHEKDR
jgi:DNA-directed RNA polymerase specialized sigma24 family protein